ncbi:MAG: heat-inducible transcription repressor HrcA [Chloroflexi bacterium]|nr:heat-inducible transcription repressor HrcA [Chloroflexota bacterium]
MSTESLTERQETVLALVVHEYIEGARPVGSKRLVNRYSLGISSATVRNDMAFMTEAGYLRQPHTSAGRVPTEQGYRYYVARLLGDTELPQSEKRLISHQFHQMRGDVDEWVRLAASVLASQSRVASLVTTPLPDRTVFKHLELIGTQGRQVLMVLVLEGGDVRQQMLTLSEPIGQAQLRQTAERLTGACAGQDANGVRAQSSRFGTLGKEIAALVSESLERADEFSSGEIHRDGLANVLSQPEFSDTESGRDALRLLEERSLLEEVLAKALSPTIGGVQVVIGGEGAWEELKDFSMVLARYGAAGYAIGTLGVFGPKRMSYGRSISAVRYVAGLMSNLVVEAFDA